METTAMVSRRSFSAYAGIGAASVLTLAALAAPARADAVPGAAAPDFSGVTATGETVSLSDFAGQTVVLEWTNHGCPYVQRHYGGNMQAQQARADNDGVVWVQVISSAPGEQGYVEGEEALSLNTERDASVDHTILDPTGVMGRAFDARTTPHMYIIDGEGVVQYAGGIDNQPRPRTNDPAPIDYVMDALDNLQAGMAPDPAATQPYGCSVKYAD